MGKLNSQEKNLIQKVKVEPKKSLSKLELASLNEDATPKASKLVTVKKFKNIFENKNLSDSVAPKEAKEFHTTNSPETSNCGIRYKI